jgi:hypothetical protein
MDDGVTDIDHYIVIRASKRPSENGASECDIGHDCTLHWRGIKTKVVVPPLPAPTPFVFVLKVNQERYL